MTADNMAERGTTTILELALVGSCGAEYAPTQKPSRP
jgi:hypothetical protein